MKLCVACSTPFSNASWTYPACGSTPSTVAGHVAFSTVPQHMSLWSQADVEAMHERRYSAAEMRGKLERAGSTVVRMTSFVSLILPLMAAQRLSKCRPDPNYSVHQELAIGGVANWSMEQLLTIERGLLRAGISFPVGGSLLAIARKR